MQYSLAVISISRITSLPLFTIFTVLTVKLFNTTSFIHSNLIQHIGRRHERIYVILDAPLQLRLQTFCKSKVFPFTFLLFTLRRVKIDCSKVPVTVVTFSVELLVTLDLTLATEFSTVRNMDYFSIVFG